MECDADSATMRGAAAAVDDGGTTTLAADDGETCELPTSLPSLSNGVCATDRAAVEDAASTGDRGSEPG